MRAKILLTIVALFLTTAAYSDGGVSQLEFENAPTWLVIPAGPDVEVMTANLDSMYDVNFGKGHMVHRAWYDANGNYRRTMRIDVAIPVPNKIPGFDNLHDAMDADVHVQFSHHGMVYTECMLAPKPVVSRSAVYFTVDLGAYNDKLKAYRGICDVDVLEEGVQAGIPSLDHGVYITTHVDDEAIGDFEFLEGWCD